MQCNELEAVLEQRDAAELPPAAADHVQGCERCRALIADFTAIEAVAREFAAEPAEPPERVWVALRTQLESEGLIAKPRKGNWLAEWFAGAPRPLLAGAYLAFLVAVGVLVGVETQRLRRNDESLTDTRVQPAAVLGTQLNAVQQQTAPTLGHIDPVVSASFRQSLDIVDNAIAMCEKSMREDPRDPMAREYLYAAYQQKAELLTAMMDRGARGD